MVSKDHFTNPNKHFCAVALPRAHPASPWQNLHSKGQSSHFHFQHFSESFNINWPSLSASLLSNLPHPYAIHINSVPKLFLPSLSLSILLFLGSFSRNHQPRLITPAPPDVVFNSIHPSIPTAKVCLLSKAEFPEGKGLLAKTSPSDYLLVT